MSQKNKNSLLEHALVYADLGWEVIPWSRKRKKEGTSWSKSTTDPIKIRRYWEVESPPNIALKTGNLFWVFDVDGNDGLEILSQWEKIYGKLPATPKAISGSGFPHYYFSYNPQLKLVSKAKIFPGIDIRAEGGIIFAPPSHFLLEEKYGIPHSPYYWDDFRDGQLALAPEWLLDKILRSDQKIIFDASQTLLAPSKGIPVDMSEIVNRLGFNLTPIGGDEYIGIHMIHGSDTGGNVKVNFRKNFWHCFRCGVGGDALKLYAVMKGWIPCGEKLRGDLFKNTLKDLGIDSTYKHKFPLLDRSNYLPLQPNTSALSSFHKKIPVHNDEDNMETFESVSEDNIIPTDWIFEDFLDKGAYFNVFADGKSGKSYFAIQLAMKAALGESFLGFEITKRRKTLYLQKEIRSNKIKERLMDFKRDLSDNQIEILDQNFMFETIKSNQYLDKSGEVLKKRIIKSGAEVVIIDPLQRFSLIELNNREQVLELMTLFQDLSQQLNICLIFVHHKKKVYDVASSENDSSGAKALTDCPDGVFYFSYPQKKSIPENMKKKCRVKLVSFKMRNAFEIDDFLIYTDSKYDIWYKRYDEINSIEEAVQENVSYWVQEVVKFIAENEGCSSKSVCAFFHGVCTERSVMRYLSKARDRNLVYCKKLKQKNTSSWFVYKNLGHSMAEPVITVITEKISNDSASNDNGLSLLKNNNNNNNLTSNDSTFPLNALFVHLPIKYANFSNDNSVMTMPVMTGKNENVQKVIHSPPEVKKTSITPVDNSVDNPVDNSVDNPVDNSVDNPVDNLQEIEDKDLDNDENYNKKTNEIMERWKNWKPKDT